MHNQILRDMDWSAEGGSYTYKGLRYMFIRPEPIIDLQLSVEAALGREQAAELVAKAGRLGGESSYTNYRDVHALDNAAATAFMASMGPQIGWGRFTVLRLDEAAGELAIQVDNSPFAATYRSLAGTQEQPVCHFIRGVWGGLAAACLGGPVSEEETACLAMGDPACRFRYLRR